MRFIDRTNNKYGLLKVLNRAPNASCESNSNIIMWECICKCGNKITVSGSNLQTGHIWHCGCQDNRSMITKKQKPHIKAIERGTIYKHNKSGVKGVFQRKDTQKWYATLEHDNIKEKKMFDTKEQAIIQRKEWEKEYHFPMVNNLNQIREFLKRFKPIQDINCTN